MLNFSSGVSHTAETLEIHESETVHSMLHIHTALRPTNQASMPSLCNRRLEANILRSWSSKQGCGSCIFGSG